MQRKPNKLRLKLKEGRVVTGSVIYSWSPNIMEISGYSGLDFMRIDNEHAWPQDRMPEHLIRAASIFEVVPLMRVDRDNPYLIRKALEIGAGAVVVPNIHTPDEAEAVVKASKFPPAGVRGYSATCWSGGWGTKGGKEWVEWSDTEPMIGVMIEHIVAMEKIEEILSVEGLDYVLFGPADFSMSLGLREPRKNHPDVQNAMTKTVAAAKKYGKHVMLGVGTNIDEIKKYVDMGITMLEFSSDLAILHSVWEKTNRAILEINKKDLASGSES
jgi:2-keto-3-deoxy-L-rhamnonate aldolase RhmA